MVESVFEVINSEVASRTQGKILLRGHWRQQTSGNPQTDDPGDRTAKILRILPLIRLVSQSEAAFPISFSASGFPSHIRLQVASFSFHILPHIAALQASTKLLQRCLNIGNLGSHSFHFSRLLQWSILDTRSKPPGSWPTIALPSLQRGSVIPRNQPWNWKNRQNPENQLESGRKPSQIGMPSPTYLSRTSSLPLPLLKVHFSSLPPVRRRCYLIWSHADTFHSDCSHKRNREHCSANV